MKFTLNGQEVDAQSATADTPLLYVLRNDMQLNGPKFGCGLGECGACAVLIDGKVARSCSVPLKAVDGKKVTTLEGLSPDASKAANAPTSAASGHVSQADITPMLISVEITCVTLTFIIVASSDTVTNSVSFSILLSLRSALASAESFSATASSVTRQLM